jgi:hypothetical protein
MWKYANPGDFELLHSHSGRTYLNIEDPVKAPKTGIAYTCQAQEDSPIEIPDGTTDIWLKMDIYVKDKAMVVFQSTTTAYNVTVKLEEAAWSVSSSYRGYDFNTQRFSILTNFKEDNMELDGKVVVLEIAIKSRKLNESSPLNGSDGMVEVRLNHKIIYQLKNIAIFNGEDIKLDTITSNFGYSYFSNIIVSDSRVQGRENVLVLPIVETTLDGWYKVMEDGTLVEYRTNGVGNSITQKVDVDKLRQTVGEDITITSIHMKAMGLSTDDPDTVNGIDKLIKVGGNEVSVGITDINSTSNLTQAVLVNPFTSEAWTLDDLENTELVLRTTKFES